MQRLRILLPLQYDVHKHLSHYTTKIFNSILVTYILTKRINKCFWQYLYQETSFISIFTSPIMQCTFTTNILKNGAIWLHPNVNSLVNTYHMLLLCAGCLFWNGLRKGGLTHSTQDSQLRHEGEKRTHFHIAHQHTMPLKIRSKMAEYT